jgi:hypothetical protein
VAADSRVVDTASGAHNDYFCKINAFGRLGTISSFYDRSLPPHLLLYGRSQRWKSFVNPGTESMSMSLLNFGQGLGGSSDEFVDDPQFPLTIRGPVRVEDFVEPYCWFL